MRLARARWLAPEGAIVEGAIDMVEGRLCCRPGDRGPGDLDASGALVLPGLVDAHTHLREPGQAHKEGIDNGTRAALAGGVTTVLDMPNDAPPTTTAARLADKHALFAAHSRVNWGLFLQAAPADPDSAPEPPVDPTRIPAAKLYMARSSSALCGLPAAEQVEQVLRTWPVVTVHAEDERLFTEEAAHHLARPREAVLAALSTLERVLRSLSDPPRIVLAHLSTAEEVAWVRRLRDEGFDLHAETCPHYLWLTQDRALQSGPLLKVNPPLRTAADRAAIRQALADGTIHFVSTDHAPHTPADKASARPPSGIAGIEWLAPLVLELCEQGVLPWHRLSEVICAGACRAYHIPDRDGLREGNVADLCLVRRSTRPRPVITRAATNPYQHLALSWEVVTTVVGGHSAYSRAHPTTSEDHFSEHRAATGVYA